MTTELTIDTSYVKLINSANHIDVSILLDSIWAVITHYQYLYISVNITIPILSHTAHAINLPLNQEYRTNSLSEISKIVHLSAEFPGEVDPARPLSGSASALCYNKV